MPNVLLLDAAFAAAPIYNALVAAGHQVYTMGNRPLDLLACKAGAHWIEQNYGDANQVAQTVAAMHIMHVVPGCTDVSLETCLEVAPDRSLVDSVETNLILTDKSRFREICLELDLPAPRVIRESQFPLPGYYICKPVDAFSGRGITVFSGNDMAAFDEACRSAREQSRSGRFLIETFAEGELYSCSAFVDGRKLSDVFYVREGSSANPYAVDTSYVADDLPTDMTQLLESSLERLCEALELKDGLLHTQFILSDGKPFIVELTRRCPGDLYSMLIEYSTGYEYAARYASYFTGGKHDTTRHFKRHILRHTVTSIENAVYEGLRFHKPFAVKAFFPLQTMGQDMLARQASRAGVLFTESATSEELVRDYQTFLARQAYEVSR